MKLISQNRKARHNYNILETYEAGIVLNGDEVKALREGHCSLVESFARMDKGEATLYNMNIPEYKFSSSFSSPPFRDRKLLLHKREIFKLYEKTKKKGYSLIPLKIYFNEKGYIKIQIGVCQGKKLYDKRTALKDAAIKRDISREIKKY